jgi:hypothetical protein
MRYIIEPAPILMFDADHNRPFMFGEAPLLMTLETFVRIFVANDPKAARTLANVMAMTDFLTKITPGRGPAELRAGLVYEVSEADWTFIKGIVEEPSNGYHVPALARLALPWARAIVEAKITKPEVI